MTKDIQHPEVTSEITSFICLKKKMKKDQKPDKRFRKGYLG